MSNQIKSKNRKSRCGILGATGTVGQKFILLLADHPELQVYKLGASPRSVGKKYHEVVRWRQTSPIPESAINLTILECKSIFFNDCDVVFSGLDSNVAGEIEMEFLLADIAVCSNAKNYRQHTKVPLIVPTVNSGHMDLIWHQREIYSLSRGFLIANANCAITGISVALAALQNYWPIEWAIITTLQAVSGAGYPGVSACDIIDNVIPFIDDEEDKVESEGNKILGSLSKSKDSIENIDIQFSATCTRVPVCDGHMACVTVGFKSPHQPDVEDVIHAFEGYTCEAQTLGCHSAPKKVIHVFGANEQDRPQPKLDKNLDRGYGVSVGRIRKEEKSKISSIKFLCLSHNTIIGAAGSSILNAEIALRKGFII